MELKLQLELLSLIGANCFESSENAQVSKKKPTT